MHAACSLPERWHALQRGLLGKACHDMAWYGMSKIHLLSFIYIIGRHLFGDLWVPFPSYFRAVLLEKGAKTSKKRSFMQVGQVKTRLTSPSPVQRFAHICAFFISFFAVNFLPEESTRTQQIQMNYGSFLTSGRVATLIRMSLPSVFGLIAVSRETMDPLHMQVLGVVFDIFWHH